MFLHCWPVCTSAFRKASLGTVLWAAAILLLGLGAAGAAPADHRKHAERSGEVDTEHMFGFTEGSDIGDKGEKELETDSTGRFGRLGGSYNNVATAFEAKYTLAESFRLSALATVAYYDISGVSELDGRHQGVVRSLSFEARYRVFDREHAPFGLTFSVEPHWGFADDVSGAPADEQAAAFRLLADRELIPGPLYGAFNIDYDPVQTRLRGSGETFRDSTLELARPSRCKSCQTSLLARRRAAFGITKGLASTISRDRPFISARLSTRPLAKDISSRQRGTCRSGARSPEAWARSILPISSVIKRSCASALRFEPCVKRRVRHAPGPE